MIDKIVRVHFPIHNKKNHYMSLIFYYKIGKFFNNKLINQLLHISYILVFNEIIYSGYEKQFFFYFNKYFSFERKMNKYIFEKTK